MPPVVVSLINLKGGVGKTTTTVQLAECLVSEYGKKVLVIDLDPQTNSTIALIEEERWQAINKNGQTISQLFIDKLDRTRRFDLTTAIQAGVSNLKLTNLSLLASSLDLIHVQDRLGDIAHKTGFTLNPMEVLKSTIACVLDRYEYVLIDCPPNLGFITRNGIEISDFYLVPTIPDTLSTYGVGQIVDSICTFALERSLRIKPLGLVWTKCDSRSSVHESTMRDYPKTLEAKCREKKLPAVRIFNTRMPQSNAYADATDFGLTATTRTFRGKWGFHTVSGRKLHEHVTDLTLQRGSSAGE